MKKSYYVRLYFNSKRTSRRKLFNFLDSLYKIEKIEAFFVLMQSSGFEVLKNMKQIQYSAHLTAREEPTILNKDEAILSAEITKTIDENSDSILALVIKDNQNVINSFNNLIQKYNFIRKVYKKIEPTEKIDIITPLNLRWDADVYKLSFLISKYAVVLENIQTQLDLQALPRIFFNFAFVSDLVNKFNKRKYYKKIILDYHQYLVRYFRFNQEENIYINKASRKYINLVDRIIRGNYEFQRNKIFTYKVDEVYRVLEKQNSLLKRVDKKFGKLHMHWIFYHWFNNSSGVHFGQEVFLVFTLRNYFECPK